MLSVESEARGLTCASGHPVDDWQTKSLDCIMDHLWLWRGKLYSRMKQGRDKDIRELFSLNKEFDQQSYECSNDEDRFVVSNHLMYYHIRNVPKSVEIHSSCIHCEPAYTPKTGPLMFRANPIYPEVRYYLDFELGQITGVRLIEAQTREELKAQLRKFGRTVLEDDDERVEEYKKYLRMTREEL